MNVPSAWLESALNTSTDGTVSLVVALRSWTRTRQDAEV